MNRFLIAALIVLIALVWWTRRAPPVPVALNPAVVSKPKPLKAKSPPVEAVKVEIAQPKTVEVGQIAPVPEATHGSRPRPPAKGTLAFVMKDGVAVAEGDIVLGKLQPGQNVDQGTTPARETKLWPTNEIPFSIQEGVTQSSAIQEAMAELQRTTPVRFVPFQGQPDSVVFVRSEEICASYLGRTGGAQPIYLSPQCTANEIIHELMHALGFVHEHSRPDRDQFLEVQWSNIDEKFWPQFWIMPDQMVHDYVGSVFSFDPESIMLYDSNAFAKSTDLLSLKARNGEVIRPSRGKLSRVDQERVTYLYGH